MQILLNGTDTQVAELKGKLGELHTYHRMPAFSSLPADLLAEAVVFDFLSSDSDTLFARYKDIKPACVFVDSVTTTLKDLVGGHTFGFKLFGWNGMPSFINRSLWEVTFLEEADRTELDHICKKLGVQYLCVEDRVGMVTPRVICMIINEAYFTVEEGTASRADIDLAMKLGTNYPFGPFEWSTRIGLQNICRLLDAVYLSTGDVRYKICTLLQQEAGTNKGKPLPSK